MSVAPVPDFARLAAPRAQPSALLEAIAPRIARAHAWRRAELAEARSYRRWLRDRLLAAERLVAHRELQAARAPFIAHGGRRGRASYIAARELKLAQARDELEELRGLARQVGVQ